MTIRDTYTMMEKTLTPNLTELLKQKGEVCLTADPRGPHDIDQELRKKKFMAVWTFTVPAKQCFVLKFFFRIWGSSDHIDKLNILDGDSVYPVALKSGLPQYELPLHNDTATVSVVYFYTSLSRNVYWRMAPSLQKTDCTC